MLHINRWYLIIIELIVIYCYYNVRFETGLLGFYWMIMCWNLLVQCVFSVGILLSDYVLKFMVSICDFVEISMVTNVKLKIEIYWFLWTLMSQAVQSGLNHRPDKNNPEVEQVGELHLSFYTTRKKYFKLNIIQMWLEFILDCRMLKCE